MANPLAELTMRRTPRQAFKRRAGAFAVPDADDGDAGDKDKNLHSIYLDPKNLTFPVVVGAVKGGWEAIQIKGLGIKSSDSEWVPFVTCITVSLLIAVSNLRANKADIIGGWPLGIILAVINGLLMFTAVLGVGEAV